MRSLSLNQGAHGLKDLFKAPMEAVVEADIELSRKITDFILNYGFDRDLGIDNAAHKLKMVNFSYTLQGEVLQFSIPILTLIQLPLLRIKTVEFDMRVKLYTIGHTHARNAPSLLQPKLRAAAVKPTISAFLAPNTVENNNSSKSNMNVKLQMVDGDMPAGMIQLLGLLHELNSKQQ